MVLNFLNSSFDFNLIYQSSLSISITLLGMIFTSHFFKNALDHKSLNYYPFILISSTILGFKGNIELGYVMHLSTLRTHFSFSDFKKIAISNTCFILVQSFVVGLISAILGISEIFLKHKYSLHLCTEIFVSSILTCLFTTAIFSILFILSLELAVYFSADHENFLMPLLNAINDILVVSFLLIFIRGIHKLTILNHCLIGLAIILITWLCYIFIFISDNLLALQSLETLIFTFSLNIISGFILEKSADISTMIAPAYPVFTGMSTSIALIYIHKLFSNNENQILDSGTKISNSLILISLSISITYLIIAYFIRVVYSIEFSICFILLFTIQTMVLLKIIKFMIKFIKNQDKSISSNTIPLISAISDFIGTLALVGMSILLSNK